SYTKAESDGKYQPKGNYVPVGSSYTKNESDNRYKKLGNLKQFKKTASTVNADKTIVKFESNMIGKQLFATASDNRAYPVTVLPPPYQSLILWYGGNQLWGTTVTTLVTVKH
ncbi:hypothetical protein O9456_21210, partial [Proteus mirabilis]|nr:hypothetical protein [Proteus mirabilis]